MRRVDASLTDHLRSRLELALGASDDVGPPADPSALVGPPPEAIPPDERFARPVGPRRARPDDDGGSAPAAAPRRARWVEQLHEAAIRTVLRPRPDDPDGRAASGDRTADPPGDRSWDHRPTADGPVTPPGRPVTRRHVLVLMSVLTLAVLITAAAVLGARDRPAAVAAGPAAATVDGVATGAPTTGPTAAPSTVDPSAPITAPAPTPTGEGSTAAPLSVHVLGAVVRPGVVRVPAGSRVVDVLTAAGGLREGAVPGALNLAQPVADGQQVFVSDRADPPSEVRDPVGGGSGGAGAAGSPAGTVGPSGSGGSAGSGAGQVVDLNTATVEQLEQLPGIGPVTAAAIVAWREERGRFTRVEELQEVDGIGPKTYARLAPLVRV